MRLRTSGAMKATVPSMSWNSPGSVVCEASLAAAPKSAIRTLCPVESTRILPPVCVCVCVCVCVGGWVEGNRHYKL